MFFDVDLMFFDVVLSFYVVDLTFAPSSHNERTVQTPTLNGSFSTFARTFLSPCNQRNPRTSLPPLWFLKTTLG